MPAGVVAHRDQCLPMTQRAERAEVGVAEMVPDLGGADREVAARRRVALLERTEEAGDEHVAARRALLPELADEALGAREPPCGLRHLPPQHQDEREPEGATGRFGDVARRRGSAAAPLPMPSRESSSFPIR